MNAGEDPIIVKPGSYPNPNTGEQRVGICFVIDDGGTWDFGKEVDGKFTITIPSNSPWIAVRDDTPPETGKKKVAIIRVKGALSGVTSNAGDELKNLGDEIKIKYTVK